MDSQVVSVCVSLAGTLTSLLTSAYAIRQARAALLRQRTAEAAYFKFGRLLVQRPWRESDANQMKYMGEPYPLGEFGKVPDDYPKGWPVALCATNKGKEAREIKVAAAGHLELALHPLMTSADDLGHVDTDQELTILYRFDPERRGLREKFALHFETVGGEKIAQRFVFMHGLLKVQRL